MTQTTYFYIPLAYYNGTVLKCAGIINETNRAWLTRENPQGIEVQGYQGDKIKAA